MNLEYIATTRVPVSSKEEVTEYLKLCGLYFFVSSTSPEYTPITKDIKDVLADGCVQVDAVLKNDRPLDSLSIINYANLGFASHILYDKDSKSFKFRLFADRKLEDRGFESTFEPFREYMATGPKELGLAAVREVESNVEVPKHNFSIENLEKHQTDVLKHWLKNNEDEASIELTPPDNYDEYIFGDLEPSEKFIEEFEEYKCSRDIKEEAEKSVIVLRAVSNYLGKNSFIEKMKRNDKLFVEMREEFSKRFPEKSYAIENAALGILPWRHRKNMAGNFAILLDRDKYIPTLQQGGFVDCRDNFMEAEIIVPPKTDHCQNIITMYPYTNPFIPEFNQLHEEEFDDPEIMQAMIGHELGEIIMEDEQVPIEVNTLKVMVDPLERRRLAMKEGRLNDERHRKLDKLLIKIGLGEQTRKMLKTYRDKAESLIPVYKNKIREEIYAENINMSNSENILTLKDIVKDIDRKIAEIDKHKSSYPDFWTN
jgi:hypothetical protein